ncbi:hypothetical protein GOBAR_AA29661 [Gossypium barbadense]|uniref:DUF4283 domain-containing protein n=1 Tax=Gossypium barbadense TaxID=3634 RepID=A0A2P5WIW8_GOSBA|nr:hypothetical protein GOBAR_AA29661 [Gossypium barbadense]
MVFSERATWTEISKVPMHCWNYKMFKRVTGKWGTLVSMGENLSGTMNFEKIEMLISITQLKKVEEVVLLEVGDIKFPVSVREKEWSEESKNISSKMESQQEVADESVSESESVIGLESENSPEGNRNVLVEITMEKDIENEIVERECQKMLGEFNEGDHDAGSSGIFAREDFGVNRRDRVREDVVDMGLTSVMGLGDWAREDVVNMGIDLVLGSSGNLDMQLVVEEGVGSIRKEGQHLSEVNTPIVEQTSSNNSELPETGVGAFVRRLMKNFNKKSEAEEKKKHFKKGKEESRSEEKIVNLSLSDSNINNRRKVILREAKQTWEVGKKLGLRVWRDERDVIEDIMRLEYQ